MSHDNLREQSYGARRAMLADFFDFVQASDDDTREQANDALMMLDELSPNPDSPTWDTEKTEEKRTSEHAMLMQPCSLCKTQWLCSFKDATMEICPIQASNLSLMFLCTWTVLLISYSWWLMRAGPVVATGPIGVTTWMLKRVLGRLDRGKANGNNGKIRKYQQGVTWLQRTLARIPDADGDERRALFRALTIDDELSEDDESPSWNAGDDMKELWIKQHYDVHSFFSKMLEFHTLETNVSLLRAFAKAFRSRSPAPSSDSNESISDVPMETESQRYRRYMRDEQCEVSDPDQWAVWRYGTTGESSSEDTQVPEFPHEHVSAAAMGPNMYLYAATVLGCEVLALIYFSWLLCKHRIAFAEGTIRFFALLACGKRTNKQSRINEGVRTLRVRIGWTLMALLGAQVLVANFVLQLNLLTPGPKMMTLPQMWTTLALLAVLSLAVIWPSTVRSSTLDAFYLCITALCVVFVSPWHISPEHFVKFSMIPTAFVRMPTVILASRISVVIAGNMLAVANVIVRISSEDFPEPETRSIVLGLEAMSFCGVLTFAVFMNSMIQQRVVTQVACDSMSQELSAASSLLRVTCDAIIELDEKLCLSSHSKELSAMLLRDRPGASLQGKSLLEFMPPDEVPRARDFLTKKVADEAVQISAEAFHTRLVDSASSRIRVEVFQVKLQKNDGRMHSLLGLRDFTDVASISTPTQNSPRGSGNVWADDFDDEASRLRHSMTSIRSSRSSHSVNSSSREETWNSQTLILDLDMEGMVVHAASASLTSWIGLSVHEVFPSQHTTLLFQRLYGELNGDQGRNRSLAFQDLPVKGSKITGTMRPTKTRFGGVHVVLAFSHRSETSQSESGRVKRLALPTSRRGSLALSPRSTLSL
eukprot:s1062_g17.t1